MIYNNMEIQDLPGYGITWPIEDWIPFYVLEEGKYIKIWTYRYPTSLPSPKGVVVLFHTFCNYSLINAHLAQVLAENGYEAVAMDYRCYGKSGGARGNFDCMDAILQDCA
jgi:alpha-beta hydrolase superfamily lysophospholipase